jgi:hypothetical protein
MSHYEVLVRAGHTPHVALQIVLDANRGDEFCRRWIEMCRTIVKEAREEMRRESATT